MAMLIKNKIYLRSNDPLSRTTNIEVWQQNKNFIYTSTYKHTSIIFTACPITFSSGTVFFQKPKGAKRTTRPKDEFPFLHNKKGNTKYLDVRIYAGSENKTEKKTKTKQNKYI